MGHTHRCQLAFKKKKKNQVMSPSLESRVPETGSDPPIGSDRESGRDKYPIQQRVHFIKEVSLPPLNFHSIATLRTMLNLVGGRVKE